MEGAPLGATSVSALPAAAPSVAWLLVLVVVVLWWLWPWLSRPRNAPSHVTNVKRTSGAAAVSPPPVEVAAAGDSAVEGAVGAFEAQEAILPFVQLAGVPGADVEAEFACIFTDAAAAIKEALHPLPQTPEYTAATAALHRTADILDRIFQAWGLEDELSRVCRLRESGDSFRSTFGDHRAGKAAQALLGVAGFTRGDGFCTFPSEDAQAQFRALTVRLCLQKHMELQKRRGPQVWTQSSNENVVPKLGDASVGELLWVFHAPCKSVSEPSVSGKERAAEYMLRVRLKERRAELGQTLPLALHDGLSSIARVVANMRRTSSRTNGGDSLSLSAAFVDDETKGLLQKLALPPGCSVAQLEYCSHDLPHVFSLTSTTGRENNEGDSDKAADVIANEAVSTWRVQQSECLAWNMASVCGIGVSLDYTINRGFLVVLLAGFEGVWPTSEVGLADRLESLDMKQRLAKAPKSKGLGFGAQVHGLASVQDPPNLKKRRPGGG